MINTVIPIVWLAIPVGVAVVLGCFLLISFADCSNLRDRLEDAQAALDASRGRVTGLEGNLNRMTSAYDEIETRLEDLKAQMQSALDWSGAGAPNLRDAITQLKFDAMDAKGYGNAQRRVSNSLSRLYADLRTRVEALPETVAAHPKLLPTMAAIKPEATDLVRFRIFMGLTK